MNHTVSICNTDVHTFISSHPTPRLLSSSSLINITATHIQAVYVLPVHMWIVSEYSDFPPLLACKIKGPRVVDWHQTSRCAVMWWPEVCFAHTFHMRHSAELLGEPFHCCECHSRGPAGVSTPISTVSPRSVKASLFGQTDPHSYCLYSLHP